MSIYITLNSKQNWLTEMVTYYGLIGIFGSWWFPALGYAFFDSKSPEPGACICMHMWRDKYLLFKFLCTPPEINSLPLKNGAWNRILMDPFCLGPGLFEKGRAVKLRGYYLTLNKCQKALFKVYFWWVQCHQFYMLTLWVRMSNMNPLSWCPYIWLHGCYGI